MTLDALSLAVSGLEGDVDEQLSHVQRLSSNLSPLEQYLEVIAALDAQCQEANIEENDFTSYTYDELLYEHSLVRASVSKKLAFLENQMVARSMTNLTPIQLEEFESVFRHFDRDGSNTLQELEFSAALASLGLVYDETEMHEVYREVCCKESRADSTARGNGGDAAVVLSAGMRRQREKEGVGFEQFIRFMVSVTEDQNTAEQVFQSFREVADGKVSVSKCRRMTSPYICILHLALFRSLSLLKVPLSFILWTLTYLHADCLFSRQPYVTEMDLRHSLIPDDLIEDLLHSMPKHTGPDLEVDRQVPKYDYIGFMARMAGGDAIAGTSTTTNATPRVDGVKLGKHGVGVGSGTAKVEGGRVSPGKENMRPANGLGSE